MREVLNYILSKLPVFAQLNGYKTSISVALVVVMAMNRLVLDLIPLLPHVEWLLEASAMLATVLEGINRVAEIIGIPFITVTALHNKIKEQELRNGAE